MAALGTLGVKTRRRSHAALWYLLIAREQTVDELQGLFARMDFAGELGVAYVVEQRGNIGAWCQTVANQGRAVHEWRRVELIGGPGESFAAEYDGGIVVAGNGGLQSNKLGSTRVRQQSLQPWPRLQRCSSDGGPIIEQPRCAFDFLVRVSQAAAKNVGLRAWDWGLAHWWSISGTRMQQRGKC